MSSVYDKGLIRKQCLWCFLKNNVNSSLDMCLAKYLKEHVNSLVLTCVWLNFKEHVNSTSLVLTCVWLNILVIRIQSTCIKRLPLGQRQSGLIRQVTS